MSLRDAESLTRRGVAIDPSGAPAGQLVTATQDATGAASGFGLVNPTPPNTVALLGDSITNLNSDFVGLLPNVGFMPNGYWTTAAALLRYRLRQIPVSATEWEFGGSGLTTTMILSGGHVAAVVAAKPGWCIVLAGTNDIGANNAPASAVITNLQSIYQQLLAAGIRVVAVTILPRTDTNATQKQAIRDVNRWIRATAQDTPGLLLADAYPALVDPATSNALATYLVDTVHPNPFGGARVGIVVANALAGVVRPHEELPFDNGDAANLVSNPFMLGGTTTATGASVYAGGAATFTASKVARTDVIPGEWQQIAVTAAPAPNADGANALFQNTSVGTAWNVGDTVYGAWEFETDAASWAARQFNLEVLCVGGTRNSWWSFQNSAGRTALAAGSLPRLTSGIMRTPPIPITAGTTNVQLLFSIYGTGTVRLGRAALINTSRVVA